MNGPRVCRCLASLATLGLTATALASAGGGNHAAAQHSGGSLSIGTGGSLGGLLVLALLVLGVRYFMRRVGGANASGNSVPESSPLAQAAVSALGATLGASSLARIVSGEPLAGAGAWHMPVRRQLPPELDAIRQLDPGFETETFLQKAEMTFFLVKRALQRNDPAALRPYLDDQVYGMLSQGITQTATQHRHRLWTGLNVRGMALQSAVCSAQTQVLQVHFDLVYRAKTLDESQQLVSDEGADTRHGERWTFTRSATARTPESGGITAAKCPACGAELRLNLDGTCTHCKNSVTNGSVDWVVSDIQDAAYIGYSGDSPLEVAAPSVAEGIVTLTANDSAFSIEAFQARVKTAFLSLQDAWCQQKLDVGRAFLSPGAYFSWSAQLETMSIEGRRNIMEQLVVCSIEPLRVVHGRVFDDLTVRISATAADYEVDKDGKIVFGDRAVKPFHEDWTFQRSVGVATSGKPGTLENTCPSCGAPVSLTQIGECRYCKAAVASGKFDWVVSRIEQDDVANDFNGVLDDVGKQVALQVGSAVVRDLLSSVLAGKR